MTPVGPRCPDHATQGRERLRAPVQERARRRVGRFQHNEPVVTWTMIALNVVIYLVTVAQGAGINSPGGGLFFDWVLFGPAVADGGWWRLLTSAFLHGSIIHIAMNMFVLYIVGSAVETYLGSLRYLGVYLVSGLAGAAGALLVNPTQVTVGASGAIYGVFGALFIIEYRETGTLAGQAMSLIAINLVLSFAIPNISWGGHVGGLIGGIVATLVLLRFGRGRTTYGRRPDFVGISGLVLVAIVSVAVAYWKVRGYA